VFVRALKEVDEALLDCGAVELSHLVAHRDLPEPPPRVATVIDERWFLDAGVLVSRFARWGRRDRVLTTLAVTLHHRDQPRRDPRAVEAFLMALEPKPASSGRAFVWRGLPVTAQERHWPHSEENLTVEAFRAAATAALAPTFDLLAFDALVTERSERTVDALRALCVAENPLRDQALLTLVDWAAPHIAPLLTAAIDDAHAQLDVHELLTWSRLVRLVRAAVRLDGAEAR
jgi:hypothetical protein